MPIQTVFLDAGGVLVNPNWTRVSDVLACHGVTVSASALAAAEPHAKRRLDTRETIQATSDQQRGWTYFNLVLGEAGIALSDATVAALSELHVYHQQFNLWENVFAVAATDKAQHNFGWNVLEGTHCFRKKECSHEGFTLPIAEYPHEEGCSITGGFVYRGKALPQLDGRYFYADYCTGLLRSLRWKDGHTREHWDWKPAIDREGILAQVSSFGVDADGELYIVELTGSIYKLAARP